MISNIFKPSELVGYKYDLYDIKPKSLTETKQLGPIASFYCINPLKSFENLKTDNVKEFRNFLVEFDKIPIKAQKQLVKKTRLPYSMATYSGNKSIHYIVAVEEPMTLSEYKVVAAIILKFIYKNKADASCANPNRLSRTPGAIRSVEDKVTGRVKNIEQELLEVKPIIKLNELRHWVYEENKNAYLSYLVDKEIKEARQKKSEDFVKARQGNLSGKDKEELLDIYFPNYRECLESKEVNEGNRHGSAVGIAIKLYQCGFDIQELTTRITSYLENNGKNNAYNEATGIVRWVSSNIIALNFEEVDELSA